MLSGGILPIAVVPLKLKTSLLAGAFSVNKGEYDD